MSTHPVPDSYHAWRHCIEVDCGIALEASYLRQRIDALENPGDFHTQQFVRRWGKPHQQQVLDWFHQALREIDADADNHSRTV